MPTAPRIEKLPDRCKCRNPATDQIFNRRHPAENPVLVGELHPTVGEIFAIDDVQRLEDADEIGNPAQFVFIQRPATALLQRVEGSVGDPSEQLPRGFITDFPFFHDVEERPDRSAAQAFTFRSLGQIDQRRYLVAARRICIRQRHQILHFCKKYNSIYGGSQAAGDFVSSLKGTTGADRLSSRVVAPLPDRVGRSAVVTILTDLFQPLLDVGQLDRPKVPCIDADIEATARLFKERRQASVRMSVQVQRAVVALVPDFERVVAQDKQDLPSLKLEL